MRQYLNIEHYKEFYAGAPVLHLDRYSHAELTAKAEPEWSVKFRVFKIGFDYGCALIGLPVIAFMSVCLLVLNPFFNPGPLFFKQERIGKMGRAFQMWKFRTMLPSKQTSRDPNAKLEEHRISAFGRFLRKTRLDEIPNLINVLTGDMSVIGPRPDASNHVYHYSETVLGYAERHRVKPGMTGLAQVEQGYVEDQSATAVKAKYDNLYVNRSCGRLDLYILYRTIFVLVRAVGR
jgi:lipopolysaccharide/colanic/teichoic acid biosynthesis glycosyltransferase